MDYDYRHQQQEAQFEAEHQIRPFNGLNNEDEHDYYGDHHHQQQQQLDASEGIVVGATQSMSHHTSREKPENSSHAGKLFVGGISWETGEETFTDYFSKYGEIADAVIMTDKHTGRPRGFGFVTFADPAIAERVLERDHVIDGRLVEVKRTIPREETEFRGITRAKKIFIGGIPPSLTEDDLREYFSFYGSIVEHQILIDHKTGRSRGFGFVTFDSEDAVEKIFAEGKIHELGGKQVEIKKAEPKRGGGDYGSFSKSYSQFENGSGGYPASRNAGNQYVGKMGRGYGGYGGYGGSAGFGGYNSSVGYGGGYGGYGAGYMGSTGGFYGPFGGYGYGFGFNGPMMYGGGGYGGSGYVGVNNYGAASGYGCGNGYGRSGDSGFGNSKGYGNGSDKTDGHNRKGGNMNAGGGGSRRYHPYQK